MGIAAEIDEHRTMIEQQVTHFFQIACSCGWRTFKCDDAGADRAGESHETQRAVSS